MSILTAYKYNIIIINIVVMSATRKAADTEVMLELDRDMVVAVMGSVGRLEKKSKQ